MDTPKQRGQGDNGNTSDDQPLNHWKAIQLSTLMAHKWADTMPLNHNQIPVRERIGTLIGQAVTALIVAGVLYLMIINIPF